MIPYPDKSMRPGWTTPYFDESGWTGMDGVMAREQGWKLDIGALGIAVGEISSYASSPKGLQYLVQNSGMLWGGLAVLATASGNILGQDRPISDPELFARLIERVMTGDGLSYKALYLMVYNDPQRYGEYRELVEALKPSFIVQREEQLAELNESLPT